MMMANRGGSLVERGRSSRWTKLESRAPWKVETLPILSSIMPRNDFRGESPSKNEIRLNVTEMGWDGLEWDGTWGRWPPMGNDMGA